MRILNDMKHHVVARKSEHSSSAVMLVRFLESALSKPLGGFIDLAPYGSGTSVSKALSTSVACEYREPSLLACVYTHICLLALGGDLV